jgi:hypothetical protein
MVSPRRCFRQRVEAVVRRRVVRFAGVLGLFSAAFVACGPSTEPSEFVDPPAGAGGSGLGNGGSGGGPSFGSCQGLACQQAHCDNGGTTTLSGIVNAPNGTLPLYNAIVFVPQAPLDPIEDGANSCDHCGSVSGKPLVATITDVHGRFTLKDVPSGKDIPLVVQVGKWRRQITVPNVGACTDTSLAPETTRLPKNQQEGHIPKIAITTGRCDQLACLLPKLGLDATEYTPNSGSGRLHVYRGSADASKYNHVAPPGPVPAPAPSGSPDATSLWDDAAALKKYDMLLLSCECGEHLETKPGSAIRAMYDYASNGGRVFASHFHYVWGQDSGPLASTAQWAGSPSNPENPPGPFLVDTTFPKGAALAEWLVAAGASSTPGVMPISQPRENVGAVVSPTQRWVYRKTGDFFMPESAKYMNINAPVGKPPEAQCGKFVFADMHLYGGDVQPPTGALPDDGYPASCSKDLTPEEKALAFLFFELSSCVGDDSKAPQPPR